MCLEIYLYFKCENERVVGLILEFVRRVNDTLSTCNAIYSVFMSPLQSGNDIYRVSTQMDKSKESQE